MSFKFEIPIKSLTDASKIECRDEFFFIFGDEKFSCHKLIAAFISPKICQMLITDPTIDKFYFQYPIEKSRNEYKDRISSILNELIHFYRFNINSNEVNQMKDEIKRISQFSNESDIKNTELYSILSIIEQLGNAELLNAIYLQLFDSIFSQFDSDKEEKSDQKDDKKIQHKIEFIKMMNRLNNLIYFLRKGRTKNDESNFHDDENFISEIFGEKYHKMIDSISDEFYEIETEDIKEIDENILRDILHSENLKIINEDWLLEKLLERRRFIEEKQNENEGKSLSNEDFFIDEVRFEFLSSESIQKVIENLNGDEINARIWNKIKKRLILPVVNEQTNEREINENLSSSDQNKFKFSYSCSYNQGNEFEGILKHLTNTTNGNIHDNKTIEITCSCACCGSVANIVDFNDLNNCLHVSENPSPRWIKIDFKNRQIQMTSYVINTGLYAFSVANKSLKSWKIEISNDGTNWDVVDEQNDVSEIKENNKIKQFEVQPTNPFRFIRIITHKANHYNNNGFAIGNLEIYGGILETQ